MPSSAAEPSSIDSDHLISECCEETRVYYRKYESYKYLLQLYNNPFARESYILMPIKASDSGPSQDRTHPFKPEQISMTIQINTDRNLHVHEAFEAKLDRVFTDELHRYSEFITRLEVHLSDENGNKQGVNDKRCLIEARFEGRQPVTVTGHASDYENAVKDAIEKMKALLSGIVGKLNHH